MQTGENSHRSSYTLS